MLQTKSFDISDSAGVSELLKEYRLAPGAHILVSDGKVMIPYEDGAPPSVSQRIAKIREMQGELIDERDTVVLSNRVLDHFIAEADLDIGAASAALDAATSKQDKNIAKQSLDKVRAIREQKASQQFMNEQEIKRLTWNIEEHEAAIAKLNA